MKTERIRFFALLLAALLMLAMVPVAAFAVEDGNDWDSDFYLQSYSLADINGKTKTVFGPGNVVQLTLKFHVDSEIELGDGSSLILTGSDFKGMESKTDKSAGKVVYDLSSSMISEGILSFTAYLKVDSNLATGTYQLPFSVKLYKNEATSDPTPDSASDPITLSFSSVYISVNKPVIGNDDESEDEDETDPVLTPHLVITSVSTAGQQLPTDEDFTVTISFKNTGKSAALEGVMMSLTPEAGITLPKASTSFYIEKIKAGETVSQTFTLYADSDTVKSTFATLGVAFSYQYLANDAYASGTDSENVSLFFGDENAEDEKEDRFDILDMKLPDYLYPGEENYLTFTIINKGSVPVYNVMGKIESAALSNSGASEYYGQLAANTKDELELPMVALQSGEIIGTATITYELEDGTEKTIVRDFTAYAEDMGTSDPGEWIPEEPIPEETTGPKTLWYIIGGGVVAAAVLTTVLVKRAKKKKAAALADDDI